MTILQIILKLGLAFLSPEFEVVIEEIKEARRRKESRELEQAKKDAQEKHDTRALQKIAGRLSE